MKYGKWASFFFFPGRSRPLLEPASEATAAAAAPEAEHTFLASSLLQNLMLALLMARRRSSYRADLGAP